MANIDLDYFTLKSNVSGKMLWEKDTTSFSHYNCVKETL